MCPYCCCRKVVSFGHLVGPAVLAAYAATVRKTSSCTSAQLEWSLEAVLICCAAVNSAASTADDALASAASLIRTNRCSRASSRPAFAAALTRGSATAMDLKVPLAAPRHRRCSSSNASGSAGVCSTLNSRL
eukprot:GHRR01029744.1.p2 GENE.GHRR01029744.1~~GHRR01029744.1.p2  ORF type:complete len:132 (-),score=30.30 GHRR01029744.1:1029-1424(-)